MACYPQYDSDRNHVGFMCGGLGEPCRECGDIAEYLCDYPVGEGRTCDRLLCGFHADRVGPDLHYCPFHSTEWEKFRETGGVKNVLENVIPFKTV